MVFVKGVVSSFIMCIAIVIVRRTGNTCRHYNWHTIVDGHSQYVDYHAHNYHRKVNYENMKYLTTSKVQREPKFRYWYSKFQYVNNPYISIRNFGSHWFSRPDGPWLWIMVAGGNGTTFRTVFPATYARPSLYLPQFVLKPCSGHSVYWQYRKYEFSVAHTAMA